ncbi:hypothetical protein [Microvirga sp. 2TAF3]
MASLKVRFRFIDLAAMIAMVRRLVDYLGGHWNLPRACAIVGA